MKAIVTRKDSNTFQPKIIHNSEFYIDCYGSEEMAQNKADLFNSELSNHVQSQQSTEIEQLKQQLAERDRVIEELRKEVQRLQNGIDSMNLSCDGCGCHPNTVYITAQGRFCQRCKLVEKI